MKNLRAAEIFESYKIKANITFDLIARQPDHTANKHTVLSFERYSLLAEYWGELATKLSGGKINYLENWREGK